MSKPCVFIAGEPDPKPEGWTWWKDGARRASCTCGWVATGNSSNSTTASALWRDHSPVTTTDRVDLALAAVLELRSQAGDVADALADLDVTWERAVEVLHHLRLARQTVAASESLIETLTSRLMRDAGIRDQQEIPGIGVVQVRKGSNRKAWQHDELAKQVIDTHMTDTDGEIPTPWAVRDWLLEALAPSYWRTGVLKSLGIDPDEYAEVTPGRHTVQITSNDSPLDTKGATA